MRYLPALTLVFVLSPISISAAENQTSEVCAANQVVFNCTMPSSPNSDGYSWLLERISEFEDNQLGTTLYKPGLEALKSYDDGLGKWKTKLNLSYEGESVARGRSEDEIIKVGIDMSLDNFPYQNRVKVDVEVKEDNKSVDDALTNLLYNFDYYIYEGNLPILGQYELESFAFTERFTNDELLIDERWEVGFGLKLEFNKGFTSAGKSVVRLFNPNKDPFRDGVAEPNQVLIEDLANGYKNVAGTKFSESYLRKVCAVENLNECNWSDKFTEELNETNRWISQPNILRGLRRSLANVEFGVSAAILKEYLQGSVHLIGAADTNIPDFEGQEFKFSLPSDETTVLSIRPSFRWQINDKFSMDGLYYYKDRLEDGRNLRHEGSNYYEIRQLNLNYKINDKSTITLSYQGYFDNAPYLLETSAIADNTALSTIASENMFTIDDSNRSTFFSIESAPARYEKFALKITLDI